MKVEELEAAVVTQSGEMRLPNGSVIGNRKLKQYYKQYFAPKDVRPSGISIS